jgi:integrase
LKLLEACAAEPKVIPSGTGQMSRRCVPFRPIVLSMLLGLLASTGLRVAEACRLSMADVHLGDAHPPSDP